MGSNLVYNTCWEDPRLDRQALQLGPRRHGAGDHLGGLQRLGLCPGGREAGHRRGRQSAAERPAGAQAGRHPQPASSRTSSPCSAQGRLARAARDLRRQAAAFAVRLGARLLGPLDHVLRAGQPAAVLLPRHVRRLRPAGQLLHQPRRHGCGRWVDDVLATRTSPNSRNLRPAPATTGSGRRPMRFAMRRDTVLSLLGVPRAQRNQIETQYEGGIAQFVHDCVEAVFARLPLADNYFWRVYMTGRYTPDCCPEYLKPENFQRLKDGLADRIDVHTDIGARLPGEERPADLALRAPGPHGLALGKHSAVVGAGVAMDRPPRGARRAGHLAERGPADRFRRRGADHRRRADRGASASCSPTTARWPNELHPLCRVHTYGSFHIADLAA